MMDFTWWVTRQLTTADHLEEVCDEGAGTSLLAWPGASVDGGGDQTPLEGLLRTGTNARGDRMALEAPGPRVG